MVHETSVLTALCTGPIPGHNRVTVEKREELLFLIVNITERFEASGNIYPINNPMRKVIQTIPFFLLRKD